MVPFDNTNQRANISASGAMAALARNVGGGGGGIALHRGSLLINFQSNEAVTTAAAP